MNRQVTKLLTLMLAALLMTVGCAAAEGRPSVGTVTDPAAEESYAGENEIRAMQAYGAAYQQAHAPRITTLKNGVTIQRTPTEYDAGVYSQPYNTLTYNTTMLKADQRGCAACHADLAETLNQMDSYVHVDLSNSWGLDLDVNDCIDCHTYSPGYVYEYYGFGSLIHGLHSGNAAFTAMGGDCFSCHNATADGQGLTLWDNVKYDAMRGIYDTDADTVKAAFSYDQDLITSTEDFFDYSWVYYDNDFMRFGALLSGENTGDPDIYNSWTITVNGEVENEKTWTLAELIETAPSITTPATMQCTINPTGGPLIANVKITGIPMSWIFEQVGLKDTAAAILPLSTDGFATSSSLENCLKNDAYIVYQINGEPLSVSNGFPCLYWAVGGSAGCMSKQLGTITLMNEEDASYWHTYLGWLTEDGWNGANEYFNKPNVGIFDSVNSGVIINAGETYSLRGYAAAYDQKIAGIEVSLDRGKTWTRYDTPVDNVNLVQWHYSLTLDNPGAYVVYVRSVAEDGLVTPTPQKFMINVK